MTESRSAKAQAFACFSWPDTLVARVVCWHYQMWVRREGAWPIREYRVIPPWLKHSLLSPHTGSSVVCDASPPTLPVEKPLVWVSADASGSASTAAQLTVWSLTVAIASLRGSLALQLHGLLPRLADSESLGGDPRICFNSVADDSDVY